MPLITELTQIWPNHDLLCVYLLGFIGKLHSDPKLLLHFLVLSSYYCTFISRMFSIRWMFRSVLSITFIHLCYCGEFWFTFIQSVVWTLQMSSKKRKSSTYGEEHWFSYRVITPNYDTKCFKRQKNHFCNAYTERSVWKYKCVQLGEKPWVQHTILQPNEKEAAGRHIQTQTWHHLKPKTERKTERFLLNARKETNQKQREKKANQLNDPKWRRKYGIK